MSVDLNTPEGPTEPNGPGEWIVGAIVGLAALACILSLIYWVLLVVIEIAGLFIGEVKP